MSFSTPIWLVLLFLSSSSLVLYTTHATTPPPPSPPRPQCVTNKPLDFCNMLTYPLYSDANTAQSEATARQFVDDILTKRRQKLGILHEDALSFCDDLIQSSVCAALMPECDEDLVRAGERYRKPCKMVEAAIKLGCSWDMNIGDLTFAEAPDCFVFPFRAYGSSADEYKDEEDEATWDEDLRSIGDVLRLNGQRELAHYAYLHVLQHAPNDRILANKMHALMHSSEQEARYSTSLMRVLTNDDVGQSTRTCIENINKFDSRSEADAINEERKASIIVQVANTFGLRTFVETGTWYGTTIGLVQSKFDHVHSIELSQQLHNAAKQRFAGLSHVQFHWGDSAIVLPQLVQHLGSEEPVLFWLDSHFSGSRFETTRSEIDTSLVPELNAVLMDANDNHVILIDDARMFRGFDVCRGHHEVECYPTLETLQELVCRRRPNWVFEVREDIVRIYRPRNQDKSTQQEQGGEPKRRKAKKVSNTKSDEL